MTEAEQARAHELLYSCDSREELCGRIAELEELLSTASFVLWTMEQVTTVRFTADGTTFDSAYFEAKLRALGLERE